jgi:hypothetical protein
LALTTDLLNRYQRNSVAIVLRRIEMTLRSVLADLAHEEEGILFRQNGRVSGQQRDRIERIIEKALHEIGDLARRFDLPSERHDTRAALMGKLSVMWSDLHEIRARSLRGYGEVHPDLEEFLDPSVARLVDLVEELRGCLEDRHRNDVI